jgi:hypothetical protein
MSTSAFAAVVVVALTIAAIAYVTGHLHRGPFAYVLRRLVRDPAPFDAAVARMLYGTCAVLVAMAVASWLWPEHATALARWSAIAISLVVPLAWVIPGRTWRPRP